MYSRRTGVLQTSSEGLKKIESFNQNLREQYNKKSSAPTAEMKNNLTKSITNSNILNFKDIIGTEELIIIALILLLFLETERDYLLIIVFGLLLLIN